MSTTWPGAGMGMGMGLLDPYKSSASWAPSLQNPSVMPDAVSNIKSTVAPWLNTQGTFNASNPNAQMSWWDRLTANIDKDFAMAMAGSLGGGINMQSSRGSVDVGSSAPAGAKIGGADFNANAVRPYDMFTYKRPKPYAPGMPS